MHTGVIHELELDRDGKRVGQLSIPYSVDRSPYYHVQVPVGVVRNGDGPSVVLVAGNHGDEYEGILCLSRLLRLLDPARIAGRVTVLPMVNAPAVLADKRCSPLDGGNLNRAFPGDASGNPTERLAHFLEHELFPRHDVVFDLHSGGTSMEHLPSALIERDLDTARHERATQLMCSLGVENAFVADNGVSTTTSMGAARRAGCIGLSGEFGGGGTVTPQSIALTARAIDNLLLSLNITQAPLLNDGVLPAPVVRMLSLARHSQAVRADRRGWYEPAANLGDVVVAGDVAGWLHDLERPALEPSTLTFAEGGVVLSRRLHTRCEAGDCLMQVAEVLGE